jgi:hypothetical protein
VSERRRRRRTSDSDAQKVQCSRMESDRAAYTAALALLPIRLRHKRRTFCACPREPFLSIAVPAYSRGGAAIPGPTTSLARQTADGRRQRRLPIFEKRSRNLGSAAPPKSITTSCCRRQRAPASPPPPRRSHGCPEEDAQVCADEASHW